MYSQCPDCLTRFRVTAEMLRAARGTVRCGRCGSAFDALERLSDTIPPSGRGSSAGATAASATDPELGTEYHFTAEDLERVFVEARDWREMAAATGLPAALESSDTGDETPVVVHEDTGVEDITLEGERIRIEALTGEPAAELDLDSTDEFEILRQVPDSAHPDVEEQSDREIEEFTRALEEAPAPPPEPVPEPTAEPMPLAAQRWQRPAEEEEPQAAAHGSAWRAFAWSLGAFVLALVLAAQVMHHFRQDLVRHPQLGPPLRAAYERLGLDLLPNWDLAAFELRQWGNTADAAAQGRMAVRASLTNRAKFAQPHPVLRLELEDRFGAVVATRDFEPSDYLKNPSQATRLIAPGSSSEAELLLADPGRDAVGYRLDICLRESATLLRCARGPG